MKSMTNKILISLLFLFIAGAFGCNQQSGDTGDELKKINVYCDESIYDMMKPLCASFDSSDTQGELALKRTSAFDAMARLLAGDTHVILLGRDYSRQEDSLMKAFSVKPHTKMSFATDALIFYVSVHSAMDTLTDKQIKDYLMNPDATLAPNNTKYPAKPEIVINSHLSSEYFNLKKFINEGKNLGRKLRMFSTSDSVRNYINLHPEAIGIGYLSGIVNESRFRAIAISFKDKAGNYIFPHVVHQTNIAQNFYPYVITHYAYIFDNRQDLPMRFGRFLSKAPAAQRYFNQFGIVPVFAKVKLIEEG